MKKNIFVALDFSSFDKALDVANGVKNDAAGLKITNELFSICGKDGISKLANIGLEIFLDIKVYDAWDNLIEAPPLSVEFTPATGINLQDDGTYLIEEEGLYGLSIAIESSALAVGATIDSPRSFNLVVDGLGPEINIATPERAAYITSSSSTQNVTLSVSDTVSEITAFTFNGVDHISELSAGTFSLSMDSRWGLNIIEASASDACGNQTLLSQSYLQSDAFALTSGSITRGVSAYLDQDVLDDGNRSDIDDLGTLAWEVLKGMDLDSEIPQELGSGSVLFGAIDYVATKGGALTYDEPTLDYLYALDNGLSLYLTITNFSLPIDVDLDPIIGSSIEGTADIIATAIYVDLSKVALSMVGGQVVASIAEDDIAITFSENSPAVVNLTLTGYEWLDELLEDLGDIAMDIFKPSIEEELEQTVRDEIPPMLEEIFNDFEMDASFTVPEPLSSTMNLSSSLDGMVFSGPAGSGQAVLELAAQVAPGSVGENIRDDAKGVGLKSGNGLSWPSSANFALGIKDDVFNQILWALWYGGTFDMAQSAVDELLTGESAEGVDVSEDIQLCIGGFQRHIGGHFVAYSHIPTADGEVDVVLILTS